MWFGISAVLMYWCHVWCMVVIVGSTSFGSFLCSVLAGRRRVALRVLIAVLNCCLGLYLCPFGSFDITAAVGWIWYVRVPSGSCVLVISEFH